MGCIESAEGKYDWLFWDDFVKMAVDEYGITLLPYLCYTPHWISEGAKDTMYFWNYPPTDNKPWGDFIKALVNRYKDRIKTWELWNEPDIWIYWQGSRKQFVDFMQVGAEAVREADPTAKIVFPGIAYDPEFVKDLFNIGSEPEPSQSGSESPENSPEPEPSSGRPDWSGSAMTSSSRSRRSRSG